MIACDNDECQREWVWCLTLQLILPLHLIRFFSSIWVAQALMPLRRGDGIAESAKKDLEG
jgi:hypothetical protein